MKQVISQYSFNKANKTVTLTDFGSINLDRLLLITNVTRGEVVYQFNDAMLGGTVAGNVLTLNHDTSAMNNNDKLQIFYDTANGDPVYEPPAPVNQGDLSDDLDSVAISQKQIVTTGYTVSSPGSLPATLIPVTDISKYAEVEVKITGTFSAFVMFFFSHDGAAWTPDITIGVGSIFKLPRRGRYFKAEVISYTSGSVNAQMALNVIPTTFTGIGRVAFPAPSDALLVGMRDSNGNLVEMRTASAVGDAGSGNQVYAVEPFGFNGTNHDRLRFANIFKTATATIAGDTAVWTPTTGKRFRVLGYMLSVSANATIAAGGIVNINLRDTTTGIGLTHDIYIPTTSGTSLDGGFSTPWIMLSNGRAAAAINNVLNVNLSTTLTAGQVRVNVMGTEE